MLEDYEEQGMLFYTVEEYQKSWSYGYYAGCATGAVAMCVIGFISLWIAGAFVSP